MRKEWVEISDDLDLEEVRERIVDEGLLVRLERIVTLKQIGTAGGPSILVSAGMLLARWIVRHDSFDLGSGVAGIIVGVPLVCLGWLKGAQQAEFVARHGTRVRN